MTKAAYPTIGIAAFVILVVYFIGCLHISRLDRWNECGGVITKAGCALQLVSTPCFYIKIDNQ